MTVGKSAIDLQKKTDEKINPIEMQREMHKSFEEEFSICFERGKNSYSSDFFIVVLFKKERVLKNVVRQYFICRKTCPTPEFDQSVWHYHKKSDELEFLWTLPDPGTCSSLMLHKVEIPLDQMHLVEYVEEFAEGKLDILCRKLNNEIEEK